MEARVERPITLHMMGDWGIANLHRICGWISAELWRRSPAGSKFATWAGRGGTDAIAAVLDGEVQAALFVPAGFARTIFEGRGICERADVHRLRALGTLPQDDRLVFAIDASFGIAKLRRLAGEASGATPHNRSGRRCQHGRLCGSPHVGGLGLSAAKIESWGGKLLLGEAPWDIIPLVTRGDADAVLFEAVMTPYWENVCLKENEFPALRGLQRSAKLKPNSPGNGLKSQPTDFRACRGRSRLSTSPISCSSAATTFLMTLPMSSRSLLCETPEILESQYRHIPPKDSPVTYPLRPRKIATTPIPLAIGARTLLPAEWLFITAVHFRNWPIVSFRCGATNRRL